jgi:hypothetical protein
MGGNEIEAVRALLSSKPRPEEWAARRQRLDEVGSVWPVAGDVELAPVDLGGLPGEWSMAPGSNVELADAYLPARLDRTDPRVSPLYADLRGFPPTLVQVGSDETLLDDAMRFAAAAGAADVAVILEIWPHMIHAWHLWNARLEPGRRALARAGAFMRDHLGLTLAKLGGVSECVVHAMPDMAGNFHGISVRPRHERNLMCAYFATNCGDGVAEGQDRFRIPSSGSGFELW